MIFTGKIGVGVIGLGGVAEIDIFHGISLIKMLR